MIAVMCRCSKTKKLFGMRFDKVGRNAWECAWAFHMKEGAISVKADSHRR